MSKSFDLTGQRFGKLVALKPTGEKYKDGSAIWLCRCDCKKECMVVSYALRRGSTQSCGCLRGEIAREKRSIKLAGQRFGSLVAIQPTKERDSSGNVIWQCLCDCKNECFVSVPHLKNGDTQSCGCLARKRTSERSRRDLKNQRFGKLLVLESTESRTSDGSIVWRCLCDCKKECFISSRSLKAGTRSCGCLNRDIMSARKSFKHPCWLGGISSEPYSFDFNYDLKEQIRNRDSHFCKLCGAIKKKKGRQHSVHHIDYNKKNCSPYNLISLCNACNAKVNYHRDFYRAFFTELMLTYYWEAAYDKSHV